VVRAGAPLVNQPMLSIGEPTEHLDEITQPPGSSTRD
jgi:hypothetical protein